MAKIKLVEAHPRANHSKIDSLGESRKVQRPTKQYLKMFAEGSYERGFEEDYEDFVQLCLEDGYTANKDDYEVYLDFYDSCIKPPWGGSESDESMRMTPKVKKWYDAVIRDFKDDPDKEEMGYEIEEVLDILSLDEEDVETAAFASLIDALSDAGYEMM